MSPCFLIHLNLSNLPDHTTTQPDSWKASAAGPEAAEQLARLQAKLLLLEASEEEAKRQELRKRERRRDAGGGWFEEEVFFRWIWWGCFCLKGKRKIIEVSEVISDVYLCFCIEVRSQVWCFLMFTCVFWSLFRVGVGFVKYKISHYVSFERSPWKAAQTPELHVYNIYIYILVSTEAYTLEKTTIQQKTRHTESTLYNLWRFSISQSC